MAWKFKIFNLFRQPLKKGQVTSDKYIPFFEDRSDNFPLEWAKVISESPSGSACLSTVQDFLQGYGFSDPDLEKRIVNSKSETFFQIHQQTADSLGQYDGFYWLIRFSKAGTINEIEVLPFENCRLGKPDDVGYIRHIFYNPFFGTKEYTGKNDKHTIVYDVFNYTAAKEQIRNDPDKFRGQVFFYGTTSALSRFYPIPSAISCKKWMKIEAGVSDYHEDNINNGFLQPYMLIMKGDPNAPSTNPDYTNASGTDQPITVAEELDRVIAENFMGAKRVGNMFIQWVNNSDEKPEILALPSNGNGDLFLTVDNQATKKITVAWKVPGVLANIHEGVSLGGDANQIRVAVKLMQQRSKPKQRILTDNYSKILRLMSTPYTEEITITPYNPYPELEVLDDKIWDAMTAEERRKWINDNTEIELFEGDEPVLTENPAATARISNAIPVPFPENVKKVVKRTMEYIEKMGVNCGGKGGRQVAEAILNNTSMGLKQMKRIHNYLKKRDNLKDSPYNEGCDVVEYNMWGGKEMEKFLESKLKEVDVWLND